MWLFNPGNPDRGTPKFHERDKYPTAASSAQVSLPNFFRFDVDGNELMRTYYPGIDGRHYVKRFYPNGKLVSDFKDGPNGKSFLEFLPNPSNKLYRVFIGPSLPAGYKFGLAINGEFITEQPSLTADAVLEFLAEKAGIVPESYVLRPWAKWDDNQVPITRIYFQVMILSLNPRDVVSIESYIHFRVWDPEEIDYILTTEVGSGSTGWHIEFSGAIVGVMQTPFLLFHNWIIGDLAADWDGPLWFDVMSPFKLDLYELLIDDTSNPYSPGTILRGDLLGHTTVYPAWS